MTKTPYEIRMDLLHLAFGILNSQREADTNVVTGRRKAAPTSADIIAEAEKLNAFVSEAKESKRGKRRGRGYEETGI